ncbi:MAG: hypothetical protein AB8G17_08205 [Gammaproteobacteria bacterium]
MTQSANNTLHIPNIVRAFATTRVMSGLRPMHRDSADPHNRRGAMHTPAQTISQLMQTMTTHGT